MNDQSKLKYATKESAYSFLSEWINDELPASEKKILDQSFGDDAHRVKETFQDYRGSLQSSLSEYFVDVQQKQVLLDLIQDPETRKKVESTKMNRIKNVQKKSNRKSFLIFGVVLVLLFLALSQFFFQKKAEEPLNPLHLALEASVLEEDLDRELVMPTASINEAKSFLLADPTLDFTPALIEPIDPNMQLKGASSINYPPPVMVIVFEDTNNPGEYIHYFNYKGDVADLENYSASNYLGMLYTAHETAEHFLVAWNSTSEPGVVAMLVGKRPPQKLIETFKSSFKLSDVVN